MQLQNFFPTNLRCIHHNILQFTNMTLHNFTIQKLNSIQNEYYCKLSWMKEQHISFYKFYHTKQFHPITKNNQSSLTTIPHTSPHTPPTCSANNSSSHKMLNQKKLTSKNKPIGESGISFVGSKYINDHQQWTTNHVQHDQQSIKSHMQQYII